MRFPPFPLSFLLMVVAARPAAAQVAVDASLAAAARQVASTTRYAPTLQLRGSLPVGDGWIATLANALSVTIPIGYRDEVGLHDTLTVGVGRAWPALVFDVRAGASAYRLVACNAGLNVCGRAIGIAPSLAGSLDVYVSSWWNGRVGARVAASATAFVGESPVVAGTWALEASAGIVVRSARSSR